MTTVLEELMREFPGEVAADQATLEADAVDASIFKIRPIAVVYPKTIQEVEALVNFALAHKDQGVSLTARSAGTDMSGGPLNDSLIVDFTKYFTRIGPVQDDHITVQPGAFYRDVEKITLAQNLLMPSYPASREICTVGGMVANNSGGEKSLSYGKTQNYVKKLQVVLADGNAYEFAPLSNSELAKKLQQTDFEGMLYKRIYELITSNKELLSGTRPAVSKNSAGYNLWDVWDGATFDMTKLIVGSQGTLGFITEITFRLIRPKPYSRLLVIFLPDTSKIADIVRTVLTYKPESFESYDDNTLKLAIRFFPEFVSRLKTNIISLAWNFLPEFWMMLAGGMPKLIMLAEFTGDSLDEVYKKINEAKGAIKSFGIKTRITKSDAETKKYWVIRRESFNLLRNHVKGKHAAPFIDDFIIPPSRMGEFLPQLEAIMKRYPLTYTIAGHVGDGNFHIIPLMNLADPQTPSIIKNVSQEVYKLIISFNGSITAEHNDGLIRTPFLEEMYGKDIIDLFGQVKQAFDPSGIFNPRKKVGLTFDQAMTYLKTSF